MRYDIECAKLASERAAALVRWKMGRGRAGLAAIASSAFFAGSIGTVLGIIGSFRGVDGEKTTLMAFLALWLSEAIWPMLAGLVIALFAAWGEGYVCARLEVLEVEMKATRLDLVNALSLLGQRIRE